MSKVKKFMTTLMLFLTISGMIIDPVTILADTRNTIEIQEADKDPTVTETADSLNNEEKELSIVSSDQFMNTKNDQKKKIGESQNSNDSPNASIKGITAQEEIQSVHDYLLEQGYEMLDDGSIISITGSAYRDTYLSVIQEVQNMLDPNNSITFASGQSVYVDKNYGSSAIGWTNSNGISELGWYAKKDVNGGMLWCIEPGIPLNWGTNSPYTTSEVSHDKYIRASLRVELTTKSDVQVEEQSDYIIVGEKDTQSDPIDFQNETEVEITAIDYAIEQRNAAIADNQTVIKDNEEEIEKNKEKAQLLEAEMVYQTDAQKTETQNSINQLNERNRQLAATNYSTEKQMEELQEQIEKLKAKQNSLNKS